MTQRLGVALTGHWLARDAIEKLVQLADRLGYEVVLVDGDPWTPRSRPHAPVYDAETLHRLALDASSKARVSQIRFPFNWEPDALAESWLRLDRLAPGRVVGFIGAGSGRQGQDPPRERVNHLASFLDKLDSPVPLALAAAKPRALALVDQHAQIWDINLPPLREHLLPARDQIQKDVETWIWVFARPGQRLEDATREYRKICPWFGHLSDLEVSNAMLWGDVEHVQLRVDVIRNELMIDVPILDLAGLNEAAARQVIESLRPDRNAKADG